VVLEGAGRPSNLHLVSDLQRVEVLGDVSGLIGLDQQREAASLSDGAHGRVRFALLDAINRGTVVSLRCVSAALKRRGGGQRVGRTALGYECQPWCPVHDRVMVVRT